MTDARQQRDVETSSIGHWASALIICHSCRGNAVRRRDVEKYHLIRFSLLKLLIVTVWVLGVL